MPKPATETVALQSLTLLIANRGRRAVELLNTDRERFVIGLRPILQDAERYLLAQKN